MGDVLLLHKVPEKTAQVLLMCVCVCVSKCIEQTLKNRECSKTNIKTFLS